MIEIQFNASLKNSRPFFIEKILRNVCVNKKFGLNLHRKTPGGGIIRFNSSVG